MGVTLKYICKHCSKEFTDRKPRVCCSKSCSTLYRIANGERLSYANNGYKQKTGEDNPSWRGNSVGKKGLHLWLKTQFGSERRCEECKATDKAVYDWALVAGKEYERKRGNFRRLCRSCHMTYDYKHGMRGVRT